MTKKQIIALVRRIINDEQASGFTEGGNLEEPEGTQELINYLDRAVDEYSKRQAGAGDVRLLKELALVSGANLPLPSDFLAIAGAVPLMINNGVMNFYGENVNVPVKYFARLPYVSGYSDDDDLPYENDQAVFIAALAAIHALNKHEFNVSQDLALLGIGGIANANTEQQA